LCHRGRGRQWLDGLRFDYDAGVEAMMDAKRPWVWVMGAAALVVAVAGCGHDRKAPSEHFDLEPPVDGSLPEGLDAGQIDPGAGSTGAGRGDVAGRGGAGSGAAGSVAPPPRCGNGVVESDEQCDGPTNLACSQFGFGGGTVACDRTCRLDVSPCSNTPDCMPEVRTSLSAACTTALCACDPKLFSICDETCARTLECAVAFCGPSRLGNDCVARNCGSSGSGSMTAIALYGCVQQNALCVGPIAPHCGNGALDAAEECDPTAGLFASCEAFGYRGGALSCDKIACRYDFSGCIENSCGDGVAEGMEACDGRDLQGLSCGSLGRGQGRLACSAACTLDTSDCALCGNSRVERDEECDGRQLRGQSCVSFGYSGGALTCDDECRLNLDDCGRCGDGTLGPGENCDGEDLGGQSCQSLGFGDGTLGCSASSCHYDTRGCATPPVCGDGVVQHDEQCDGDDVTGLDCAALGFRSGTLACNRATCRLDSSGCRGSDSGCTQRCIDESCRTALDACAEMPGCEEVRLCLDDCRLQPDLQCAARCASIATGAIATATIASDCVSDCTDECE
jgi:hypothetical protein